MATTRVPAITLDSRTLPTTNRNVIVLEAFDKLQLGGILELPEESDPRALRNEFLQHRPGRFSWDARNQGSGRWTIRIERIDEQADVPTFLSHCTPFANAKAATVRELAAQATERTYKQSETIYDEGELWPYLAFVRTGKVVYTLLSPDGKTHALGERLTHDPLNEIGHLRRRRRHLARGSADGLHASCWCRAKPSCTPCRNDAELALGFLSRRHRRRAVVRSIRSPISRSHTCLQRVAKFLACPTHRRPSGMAPRSARASKISRRRRSRPPPAPCATWPRARCFA